MYYVYNIYTIHTYFILNSLSLLCLYVSIKTNVEKKTMLIWLQWLLKQLSSLSFFCLFIVCSWEFILPHENLK